MPLTIGASLLRKEALELRSPVSLQHGDMAVKQWVMALCKKAAPSSLVRAGRSMTAASLV